MANVCLPPNVAADLKSRLVSGELDANEIANLLPDEKAAVKAILEDFAAEKLNVRVSSDELRAISEKSKNIDSAQKKLGENLGSPEHLSDNIEFFKAKKEMDDYLASHNPASNTRVLTGTIGRGMMLASVKSPLLNVVSNAELGLVESLSRRVGSRQLKLTDNKLAKEYIKMVNSVYQETGYDLSRMMSLNDPGINGSRVLDDTVHSQGKGAIRKAGRVVEDTVFKQLMGAPDVASASLHFADSVNLNAMRAAKGDKKLAREYMQDAMRLDPATDQGKALREQAILDSQYATWTNKSWASKVSLGVRKIFNDLSGDARVGDFLFPFVKTPSNVISTGLDYAGLGIPKALFTAVKGLRTGTLKDPENMQNISRNIIRSGLGLAGAAAIVANIPSENFVGAYDPKRKQIEELRNSNTNSIKIGDKWISLDAFGPLSVSITAMLYAKKYGKDPGSKAFEYAKGAGSTVMNLPGIKEVGEGYQSIQDKKSQNLGEVVGEATNYALGEVASRLIPSFISDLARGTDSYERKAQAGIESVQSKIPGLRQLLPVKKNIFGEDIRSEGFVSRVLAGSRLKTDKSDPVIKEIDRVATVNDKGANFTDWDKSNSKILSQFKEKVGQEKYNRAKELYGKNLRKQIETGIQSSDYKNMDDQDKLKFINNQDTKVMNAIYKLYGFKYKAAN